MVLRNLVKHALTRPTCYIFWQMHRTKETSSPTCALVHLVYVWGGINMISNTLVVPISAWNLRLDVFVFQNFSPARLELPAARLHS